MDQPNESLVESNNNSLIGMTMKENTKVLLPDDMWYEILLFINDYRFIIHNCTLVSKNWLAIIKERCDLSIGFSSPITKNRVELLMKSRFIERIKTVNSASVATCAEYWQAIGKMKGLTYLNTCGYQAGKNVMSCVKEIAKLESLETLYIGFNNLGDDAVKVFGGIKSLKQLSVCDNNLTYQPLLSICKLDRLVFLDVAGNDIGVEGSKIISEMTQLSEIDVAQCNIGSEGAKYLCKMHLKTLFIAGNNLTDEGAESISGMNDITTLDISDNELNDGGILKICEMKQLTALVINKNNFGEESKKTLFKLRETIMYLECDDLFA